MKDTQVTPDWIGNVHQGKRDIVSNLRMLNAIASNIRYLHPDLAEDLLSISRDIEKATSLIEKNIRQSLTEQLEDHKEFMTTTLESSLKDT